MELKLINGVFNPQETLDLITNMFGVKIKFHENKIKNSFSEEDIKMRENKIKHLQSQLGILREELKGTNEQIVVTSQIRLDGN